MAGMNDLYNMVLGDGREAVRGAAVLTLLGVPPAERLGFVGRFRDAWFERQPDGPPLMVIYTRNGGGNRADQHVAITAMRAHPLYVRDEDDDFDGTYATFWFRFPSECPPGVNATGGEWDSIRDSAVSNAEDPVDMGERWMTAIAGIGVRGE
jgi:hypothetical protein